MSAAQSPLGITLTPYPVLRKRMGLRNDVREGLISQQHADGVRELLDRAVCHYPFSHAPDPYVVQLKQAQHHALKMLDSVKSRFKPWQAALMAPRAMSLPSGTPSRVLQQASKFLTDEAGREAHWQTPISLPWSGHYATSDALSDVTGASVVRMPLSTTSAPKTTAFIGRGVHGGTLSFTLGSPLIPFLSDDFERDACSTMALMLTQCMPDHLDAALCSLAFPNERYEVRWAIRQAYQPSWFIALEEANRRYHPWRKTVHTAAARLSTVLFFAQDVYFIHSGMNSVALCDNSRCDFLFGPQHRPSLGAPLLQLAQQPWAAALHNALQATGARRGLYLSDRDGQLIPAIRTMPRSALCGMTVLMSNVSLKAHFSAAQLSAARSEHSDPTDLALSLTAILRSMGKGDEVHVTALQFPPDTLRSES
jgi:hypothetical protein